jgi:hypothetical protein
MPERIWGKKGLSSGSFDLRGLELDCKKEVSVGVPGEVEVESMGTVGAMAVVGAVGATDTGTTGGVETGRVVEVTVVVEVTGTAKVEGDVAAAGPVEVAGKFAAAGTVEATKVEDIGTVEDGSFVEATGTYDAEGPFGATGTVEVTDVVKVGRVVAAVAVRALEEAVPVGGAGIAELTESLEGAVGFTIGAARVAVEFTTAIGLTAADAVGATVTLGVTSIVGGKEGKVANPIGGFTRAARVTGGVIPAVALEIAGAVALLDA